jgi:hypothetical protein
LLKIGIKFLRVYADIAGVEKKSVFEDLNPNKFNYLDKFSIYTACHMNVPKKGWRHKCCSKKGFAIGTFF